MSARVGALEAAAASVPDEAAAAEEVRQMSVPDRRSRRSRLDREHCVLSIRRQPASRAARWGVYRAPAPANDNDLALMRRIDVPVHGVAFSGVAADGAVAARRRPRRQSNGCEG
jgi:hypothetical protein